MSHENKQTISWDWIRVWLPLILALGSIVFTYGSSSEKISASDDRIQSVEIKQQTFDSTLTDVRLDVAAIKADVSFIKNRVK